MSTGNLTGKFLPVKPPGVSPVGMGNPPRTVQLTNAPQSGMEEDVFGRCCVACMNRCADGCRRNPAICPGARGPRSATSSASPSAGPPKSTWSRQAGN